MKKAERELYLKEKLKEMRAIENALLSEGHKFISGTDEVGRGPLAGPVVAATVVLPIRFDVLGVNDSKKVSPKKRLELFDVIQEKALAIGISFISNEVIDEINILEATKKAMEESILEVDDHLTQRHGRGIDYSLIDALEIKSIKIPQKNIIKGDEKCLSIAAASIIAKVTRDRYMEKMHEEYPQYDFCSNKGYGTKNHYKGIDNAGICAIHRKTFLKSYFKMD